MFAKSKNKFPLNIKLFEIRWYQNSKSCVKPGNRKFKPHQMPPLMVRKPQWRR